MEFVYHETDKDVLIVSADGGLDLSTAGQFQTELEQLIDAGLRKIIVDCSRLTFVSSYGLSVLVRLHGRLAKHGGDVKLAAVPGRLASLLSLTRLDTLFGLYEDVDRARLAFRPRE